VADSVELVRGEAVQVVFGDAAIAEQVGEDDRQDGVAVIEGTVDLAALLTEPAFQFPEFRGFPDPGGAFLGFPDDGLQFAAEGRVCAVDSTLSGVTLYIYNASGTRVAKGSGSFSCNLSTNGFTVTHRYILDVAGRQMTEYDGSGNWLHSNVFANGELLATYSSTGSPMAFALNDWLGTKRVQAKADGEFDLSFVSLPYGDQMLSSTGATEQFFTGKERDSESGNDYFGARYYASTMGRLLSPDPERPTPLHLLNPQRWNKYSYGLNNPLSYTDSGGRDAAAVNFSKEIVMVGHEGVMSVTPDGTVRYARFGPVGGGRPTGQGQVQSFTLKTKIQFDSNGNPTPASLNAVKQELATSGPEKGQDPSTIRINYFKTTPQETENLNQWITQQQNASNQGKAPKYNVLTNNCADFCLRGLVAGDALTQSQANHMSFVPNFLWDDLNQLQSQEPKATVTTTECDTLPDGSQRCY